MSKKKSVSLSKDAQRELETAEANAAKIEGRTGQTNNYWRQLAERIRSGEQQTENSNDELEQ